ncbi:MAG: hypothetical protein HOM55_01770, partial [Proteobacteria bacterium]|nr:hypothetical protein [Pseudomonadota bacterium]
MSNKRAASKIVSTKNIPAKKGSTKRVPAKKTSANKSAANKVFTTEYRDDVCIVWMDEKDASINTIHTRLTDELNTLLDQVEQKSGLKGLVLISGKKDCFVAGADIKMLNAIKTEEDAVATLNLAHAVFNRIESLRLTTVAAINGVCLGGGLELALAFDKRVAAEHKSTHLGFPEVQLGLLPGAGGTQRTPALLGVERALDLLLTGKRLNALRAYKVGLIDDYTAPDTLLDAAIELAREPAKRTRKSPAKSIR